MLCNIWKQDLLTELTDRKLFRFHIFILSQILDWKLNNKGSKYLSFSKLGWNVHRAREEYEKEIGRIDWKSRLQNVFVSRSKMSQGVVNDCISFRMFMGNSIFFLCPGGIYTAPLVFGTSCLAVRIGIQALSTQHDRDMGIPMCPN
jgi:hypothetical protein